MSFDKLLPIWHHPNYEYFKNLNHIPHNLFLNGKNNSSLDILMKTIAKISLCKNNKSTLSCKCISCKMIAINSHPDMVVLTPENGVIKIDKIRELSNFLHYTSYYKGYKILVVNEIESMNINAANSFLKILEDSNKNILFVCSTYDKSKILPTILSRLTEYKIKINKNIVQNYLKNDNCNYFSFETIWNLSFQQPLLALNILENIEETKSSIELLLGLFNNSTNKLTIATAISDKSYTTDDIIKLLNWLMIITYDLIKIKNSSLLNNISFENYIEEYNKIEANKSILWYHNFYFEIINITNELKTNKNVNRQLLIESLFMKL